MFEKCFALTEIHGISKLDTSIVTDMSFMFNECNSLTSLPDISEWNTNNVTNMRAMFQECSSLTDLPDISISYLYFLAFIPSGKIIFPKYYKILRQ